MRKWLRRAHVWAEESICEKRHGSLFIRDNAIIAGGCNLVPSQVSDITNLPLSATIVAISLAAREGISLRGCHLYTTEVESSAVEAKMLVTLGIRAIFRHSQPSKSGVIEMLDAAGIETTYFERPIDKYKATRVC